MTRRSLQYVVLLPLLSCTLATVAGADGGKAKNVIYDGQARPQRRAFP
jgi:hypothetical protein